MPAPERVVVQGRQDVGGRRAHHVADRVRKLEGGVVVGREERQEVDQQATRHYGVVGHPAVPPQNRSGGLQAVLRSIDLRGSLPPPAGPGGEQGLCEPIAPKAVALFDTLGLEWDTG